MLFGVLLLLLIGPHLRPRLGHVHLLVDSHRRTSAATVMIITMVVAHHCGLLLHNRSVLLHEGRATVRTGVVQLLRHDQTHRSAVDRLAQRADLAVAVDNELLLLLLRLVVSVVMLAGRQEVLVLLRTLRTDHHTLRRDNRSARRYVLDLEQCVVRGDH